MQYQIITIMPASDEIKMKKNLNVQMIDNKPLSQLNPLKLFRFWCRFTQKCYFSYTKKSISREKGSPSYTKRSNYHFQSIYRWNTMSTVYRELHSYVYHYICSKIGGVKNTVCSIRTNVKLAFFKPVCRCVMLNRSTWFYFHWRDKM